MKIFLLLLIFSCTHPQKLKEGDRRLRGKNVPAFLHKYRLKNLDDLAFYEKVSGGIKVFEVKFDQVVNGREKEVSLKYSEEGKLLEREEDIDFDDLGTELLGKIRRYISQNYVGSKIHETENRTDKDQRKYIDVEIRHKSSPTGYWELSFDESGEFVSRKIEHYKMLETLN